MIHSMANSYPWSISCWLGKLYVSSQKRNCHALLSVSFEILVGSFWPNSILQYIDCWQAISTDKSLMQCVLAKFGKVALLTKKGLKFNLLFLSIFLFRDNVKNYKKILKNQVWKKVCEIWFSLLVLSLLLTCFWNDVKKIYAPFPFNTLILNLQIEFCNIFQKTFPLLL